ESVGVRAEAPCGGGGGESFWRSQVAPAFGGSRLEPRDEQVLPAPGAPQHEAGELGAPVVEMAIEFPGKTHAAVYLDILLGRLVIRLAGRHARRRPSHVPLGPILRYRPHTLVNIE